MTLTKIGTLGDVNPIEYGGGVVYRDESGRCFLEYTHGLEAEHVDGYTGPIEVYRCDIEDDVCTDLDWAKIPDVCQSIGMDEAEFRGYAKDTNAMARASCYEAIAGYYGWHEIDSYPLRLTQEELEARWDE